jgi:hypothetical protein
MSARLVLSIVIAFVVGGLWLHARGSNSVAADIQSGSRSPVLVE